MMSSFLNQCSTIELWQQTGQYENKVFTMLRKKTSTEEDRDSQHRVRLTTLTQDKADYLASSRRPNKLITTVLTRRGCDHLLSSLS